MKYILLLFLFCFSVTVKSQSLYFPPTTGTAWQTLDPADLGWCSDSINALYNLLQQTNTKSFMVLKDGKIVLEKYFGTFTADSFWYWASAGKTLTAFTLGIAQQQGLVNILNPVSQYLGTGWTSAQPNKEIQITLWNQLTMTTGLDDGVSDVDCTLPSCLQYLADAGTRWSYHNAPYTLLHAVIDSTGTSFNSFFNTKLRNKIGMNGLWLPSGYNKVYFSNTRSMARFGLLLLNNGMWNNDTILNDPAYFNSMINSSQDFNLSYGYLTWLNGKPSFMLPYSQLIFPGKVIPNAPDDMFMALGKNDQKIHVVPSKNMVVVRMGNAAYSNDLVPVTIDNQIWKKLNQMSCTTTVEMIHNRTTSNLIAYKDHKSLTLDVSYHYKSYQIYNAAGQLIQQGTVYPSLDIHSLSQGTYVIVCQERAQLFVK